MAKHAPLAKDRKSDYWWVDSRRLIEEEGFNRREDYGDIPALARGIKAQGVEYLEPFLCYKKGEFYVVIKGHRRRRAINIIQEETGEIVMVRVMLLPKGFSKETLILDQITGNDGKPFTPWEQAKVLRDLRGLGWSLEDLQARSGKSLVYVRRLLSLADAPQKLINLVQQGRISGTEAMDSIAAGTVEAAIQLAESSEKRMPPSESELFPPIEQEPPKKNKITKSDIRPNSWKVFKKWAPKVEEEALPPEKVDFFRFMKKILDGEATEKDFKKFFK